MKEKNLINVLKHVSRSGINISCIPTEINGCKGFILEPMPTDEFGKYTLFRFIDDLGDDVSYNIYNLGACNDVHAPKYITNGKASKLFGWFLTMDKMKFKLFHDEIRLDIGNTKYFYLDDSDSIIEEKYYENCKKMDVMYYFDNFMV